MTAPALLEGSEAIADAMVAAGCRFFSGYPMTPFTEVLEHMATKLPERRRHVHERRERARGGRHGVGRGGHRHAQRHRIDRPGPVADAGVADRARYARIPLVVLNMARAQGDYWQATRGPGHGDARMPVLAPMDVPEAIDAHAARVRARVPVAQPGAPLRRLLPRAHVDARSTVTPRRASRRSGRRLGARRGDERHRPRPARVAARHDQAQRARRATTYADHLARCARAHRGDAGRHRAPRRDRVLRRRRRRRGRVRHAREVRARRGHPSPRRRRAGRVRATHHACCRSRARSWHAAVGGARTRRGVREQPGADGRRRPPRRRRRGAGRVHRPAEPRQLRVRHRPRPRRRLPARRGSERRCWMVTDRFLPTDAPPTEPAHLVDDFTPSLLDVGEHSLCPGCGEPIAMRAILEAIEAVGAAYPRHRRDRDRLLHRVLEQPRHRSAPGPARSGAVVGDRGEAGEARHARHHRCRATATW